MRLVRIGGSWTAGHGRPGDPSAVWAGLLQVSSRFRDELPGQRIGNTSSKYQKSGASHVIGRNIQSGKFLTVGREASGQITIQVLTESELRIEREKRIFNDFAIRFLSLFINSFPFRPVQFMSAIFYSLRPSTVVSLVLSLGVHVVAAQPITLQQLSQRVRQATSESGETTDRDIAVAKQDLREAVAIVEERLAKADDGGLQIRQDLGWARLDGQLSDDVNLKVEALAHVVAQASRVHPGLEWDEFIAFRRAARHYMRVRHCMDSPTTRDGIDDSLERLADALQQYANRGRPEELVVIEEQVARLEQTGQAASAVMEVRRFFSHPNFVAIVSQDVVGVLGAKDVDFPREVKEIILKTKVRGKSRTTGRIALRVQPSDSQAAMQVRFVGQATSKTVGYNGPVQISSEGVTELESRSMVSLTKEGLRAGPAETKASAKNDVKDVKARKGGLLGGLVSEETITRTAWKRIRANTKESEQIVSRRAEVRINKWLEIEVAGWLDVANSVYLNYVRNPLVCLDQFPEQLELRTTEETIHLTALLRNPQQLGAPSTAPQMDEGADVVVCVHQSSVNNVLCSLLADRSISPSQLRNLWTPQTVAQESEFEVSDNAANRLVFNRHRPVCVHMDDGRVSVAVRANQLTLSQADGESLDANFCFSLENTATGVRAVMLDESDHRVAADSLAPFVRACFGTLVEQLVWREIYLPEIVNKLGRLEIKHCIADDGWLTIALERGKTGDEVNNDE